VFGPQLAYSVPAGIALMRARSSLVTKALARGPFWPGVEAAAAVPGNGYLLPGN